MRLREGDEIDESFGLIVHRAYTGNAETERSVRERKKSLTRRSAASPRKTEKNNRLVLQRGMRREPVEDTNLKLSWRYADGTTVIRVGDFPENRVRIGSMNESGVTDWDVAVGLPVDEQHRYGTHGDGLFGRDGLHVEFVSPSST